QQVGGPDRWSVVAQERPPALARGRRRSLPTVPLDRGLADRDPELLELPADPFGAPPRIRLRDRRDQLPDLGADPRPADPRPPAPRRRATPRDQAPPPAVPADARVGRDHDQVPAPVEPDETSQHPEKLVTPAEPRALAGWPREDGQLVPQQDVFRDQVGSFA